MKSRYFNIIVLIIVFCINSFKAYSQYDKQDEYIPSDSVFAKYLHERDIPIYNNNEIELLPNGRVKFERLGRDKKKVSVYPVEEGKKAE